MKKLYLLLLIFFTSSISYAQNCDCSSNLKWLIEIFEKNDAGFQYVIDKKGENAYLIHNKVFKEKASKINNKTECLKLLNDWTEFFRKNHLQIVLNENTNTSNNQKELSKKEIIEIYKDSPKFEIKEKEFNKYIESLKNKNSFEGVWISQPYTIGIIKDKNNSKRDYVGFILKSGSPYWQPNQIKLEIVKNESGKYNMKYYMRDHSIREINNIDIAGNNYLLADFIVLKRIKPVLKTDPKTELFFKSIYA
ncbi:MAG: hypothetical protein L3J60_13110, partial [Lutibacter sp.]|nr:hypothetical protein [Lutibacter sp.]